jgi:3-oxoacyl-[acyl-carrier-protein] synthase III
MKDESVLDIIAYGAWNGGTLLDNTIFESKGLSFKGDIPVNNETIEERIGVRTRMAAPQDERIGLTALEDLLSTSQIDPARIKVIIGATNVGDDKFEIGPQVKHSFARVRPFCRDALTFDLYAGCPGFNVSTELLFMLSLSGILRKGDISVVIGAENIHRARAFRSDDTANIIFGDDALATAFETTATRRPEGEYTASETVSVSFDSDFRENIARAIFELNGRERLDGIIVNNQLGKVEYRVPATAARIQHQLVELMHPDAVQKGAFDRFGTALAFYDENVSSFAFDIMSLEKDREVVNKIARSYIQSGKYSAIASVYLAPEGDTEVRIHKGKGYLFEKPDHGIVDTMTKTHGCFGDYIHAIFDDGEVFGEMNGKGVFLYATRGARHHLSELLTANRLTMADIELLIEHQANFAMIPLTLQQVLGDKQTDVKKAVYEFIAAKMVMNIHTRGNCSVVCMQRLPYDLARGALEADNIQGFAINSNTDNLKKAGLVLYDSVGAGMTRSSFLLKKN